MVCVIAGKRGDGKSTLASQIIARVIDQDMQRLHIPGSCRITCTKVGLIFK